MGVLNEMTDQIGKVHGKDTSQFRFPVNGEGVLEEYLENISEEHVLLNVLQKFSKTTNGLNRSKEYFTLYLRSRGKDLLNSTLLNEETLRILFEIVSENTYRKLNVVEIARNFPTILIPLEEMLQKYSHSKFKKTTLVTSTTTGINKEVLEEHNIQLQTAEDTLCNMEKERSQDVAISSFIDGSSSELQNLLKSLTLIVKPGGFIMFFHKESLSPAEKLLCSISGEKLEVQSSTTLEQFFQNLGLTVLSKVSDSFGNSAYLLREISPPSHHEIVYVEESNYGWVEELKKKLYEKGSESRKDLIWLIAQDSPTNGVIGMVNCLKQEPGGERIR